MVRGGASTAAGSGGARRGRYEVRREVTIGSAASSGVESDDEDLRPDAFLYDHDQRAVTPMEFTVPDDGRMAAHGHFPPLFNFSELERTLSKVTGVTVVGQRTLNGHDNM